MSRISKVIAALLCAAPFGLCADPVNLTGPVSAVVFDLRSHSIRLVTGVPGASVLGAALAANVEDAEIAPNGNAAVAVSSGQLSAISGLTSGSPSSVALASDWLRGASRSEQPSSKAALSPVGASRPKDAMPSIAGMVWNLDSTAAAVYSPLARRMLLVSNVSSSAATQAVIDLDSLPGSVTAFSIEDSGAFAIVGVSGDAAGVYLVSPQAPPMLLAGLKHPVASYLIADGDALVLDADTRQVYELRNYHTAVQVLPFRTLSESSSPVALAMSPDGQTVFVADQGCRCISATQYATHNPLSPIALQVDPAFLKPVSSGSQFLVNSPTDNSTPFWILSASSTPAVFFVSNGTQ